MRIASSGKTVPSVFVRDAEEAARCLCERSPREREARLIDVADFDISASEAPMSRARAHRAIAGQSSERFSGGLAVEFMAPSRYERLSSASGRDGGSVRLVSVLPGK